MNKVKIKSIVSIISYLKNFPLIIAYFLSKNRKVIDIDIEENMKRRDCNGNEEWNKYKSLNYLLTCYPEFRNIFYYRLGLMQYVVRIFARRMKPLYITSKHIGSGLVLFHGFSTIIYAESIGNNCTIYHNVTVGKTNSIPKIGDNVTICTGAIVVGGITVGNNCIIGAGAVVTKDIPNNCVVVGNPARIIKKDGKKVNITI